MLIALIYRASGPPFDIIATGIVTFIGADKVLLVELLQVIDDGAYQNVVTVFLRRFVDDNLRVLVLGLFHHTRYRTLAEITAVTLHRQAIAADDWHLTHRVACSPKGIVFLMAITASSFILNTEAMNAVTAPVSKSFFEGYQ